MKKIALIGNPNVGKSSLFNILTGLRQKVGNYPGMTVEKKSGIAQYKDKKYEIIDLPGTYGIYPNSIDEQVVTQVLNAPTHLQYPDLGVIISDPSNLKRGILLYQQIRDLGIPAIFVVNMMDEAEKNGISINQKYLEEELQTKVVFTDARQIKGMEELKQAFEFVPSEFETNFHPPKEFNSALNRWKEVTNNDHSYKAWQDLSQITPKYLKGEQIDTLESIRKEFQIVPKRLQVKEIVQRYEKIDQIISKSVEKREKTTKNISEKLDALLIHPVLGYIIFFGLLILIFQAIFAWSGPFMDGIDNGFAWLAESIAGILPEGPIKGLISDGIISGIGGIVIFVPQIVILFFFISLMEESGYMSRVVYLMDRWLKPFGLSGKSAVPLMSGAACAIPAVMSARNIENNKERLITILVTPFMTCSARLPIYVVIIGLIIPESSFAGFNLQGIALFAMYILGILGAFGSAWVLKQIIKTNFKSYLILELPTYKIPVWRNVLFTVYEKSLGFLWGAGKIILAMSIILWVLGTFGVSDKFQNAEEIITKERHINWSILF
jgi:ferrous iron transport protein B